MRERTGEDVVSSLGDCEFCWGWSRNWDTGTDGTGQKATCRQAGQAGRLEERLAGREVVQGGAKEGKEVRDGAWGELGLPGHGLAGLAGRMWVTDRIGRLSH